MIPKEIREKIETKLKLDKEIYEWIENNLDTEGLFFESMKIVDEPSGDEQDNGEYCEQYVGYLGDDFSGHYYFPLDNGKYLDFYFEC
ncbi:MAG: hypothetical protein KHY88_00325 [Erysipelotrichaceae bacterium]|nr:hypothetical protein [Erysipelotrichaceae bacterium]